MNNLSDHSHLYTEFDPDALLFGRRFRIFNNQIIFRDLNTGKIQITNIDHEKDYSSKDLSLLPLGAPYQLIGGKLIFHQNLDDIHRKVLENMINILSLHIQEKNMGKIGYTPLDWKCDENNVLKPDLIYFDSNHQDNDFKQITSLPDCVFEITSESEEELFELKKNVYQQAGVKEFWKLVPDEIDVEIFILQENGYKLYDTASCNERITSTIISDLDIAVNDIFE